MNTFNVLTIKLLFTSMLLFASSFTLAADEVKLQYARYFQSDLSGSCEVCSTFNGVIEVKNIAYTKAVTVHYIGGFTNNWTTTPASYIGPSRPGFEYWGFSVGLLGDETDFAIQYQVSGQTYWDNNNNADYFVDIDGPLIANPDINLLLSNNQAPLIQRFPAFVGYLGSVHLRNLAFQKEVFIRYTTDDWVSYKDANATYAATESSGLERWGFSLELPVSAQHIEFAIGYKVAGATYWDNNLLRRNYRFALPQ